MRLQRAGCDLATSNKADRTVRTALQSGQRALLSLHEALICKRQKCVKDLLAPKELFFWTQLEGRKEN